MVINQQIVGAADKVVELEEKLTRLRNKAKLERTELSGKVRKKPEKYGIIKITEAAIKDVVESYPLEADELVIEMTTRHGKAKNIVTGLMEKRRAMESILEMYNLQWWAIPKDKKGNAPKMKQEIEYNRRHKR